MLGSLFLCWAAQDERDVGIPERAQGRATKAAKGLQRVMFEERLGELGLFSLEERRLMGISSMSRNT